jgi:DNA-binding transcriptional regulator YdaS (Cro superfamily)
MRQSVVPEKPNRAIDAPFGLCELLGMKIADFRKGVLGDCQEAFARRLGLSSKSHISAIEQANRCSPKLALEIERLSEGKVNAAEICPDVALVRQEARGAA